MNLPKPPRPNFIIVGAMKAGTTTLANMLSQHPQVFIPHKEVHYFDKDHNYFQSISWYQNHFQEASQEMAIGEKTPTYSYQPNVAERIYKDFPNVKLIWMLREPVARAYSNYWHTVRGGKENLNFEEAIARESDRIKENIFYGYIKRSIYVEQIKRYLTFFPKKNMHFILMEELIENPEKVLKELSIFLEINPELSRDIFLVNRNQTSSSTIIKIPRFFWMSQKLNQYFPKQHILYKINRKLNTKTIKPSPINVETKKSLQKYFKNFNLELSKLIEKDLSLWYF